MTRRSPYGRDSWRRRRAYTLLHMLFLVFAMGLVLSMATEGVVLVLRANRAVFGRTNEYSALNAWLHVVRQDARGATGVRCLPDSDSRSGGFAFETPGGPVRHRFEGDTVVRSTGDEEAEDAQTVFRLPHMRVDVTAEGSRVHLDILWEFAPEGRSAQRPRRLEVDLFAGRGYGS